MRRSNRRGKERGFVLITSLMIMALFMVYGSSLTLRTMTQQLAANQLRSRTQAVDLAQGAVEQLRADLYRFLVNDVQMPVGINACSGNAVCAFNWLDALGASISGGGPAPAPAFTPNTAIADLPTIQATAPTAQIAQIVSTNAADPLAARQMTINGTATVNGITLRVQAVYDIKLATATIFRYAYFLNNYGWINNNSGWVTINGEIRSNGDLTFSGSRGTETNGDLYASKNPALGMDGIISGSPLGWLPYWYWLWHENDAGGGSWRPGRQLTLFGAPPSTILPLGLGYDITLNTGKVNPNNQYIAPRRYEHQPIQPVPYLGNLDRYKNLARAYSSTAHPNGGYLLYTNPGPDTMWEWGSQRIDYQNDPANTAPPDDTYTSTPVTDGIYHGDPARPLILIGTPSQPIVIDGPVVVPGDVVIRGVITGRGTIYAGRNIQVVDQIQYKNRPKWLTLERDVVTGQIRERCVSESWKRESNLGTVCNNGAFFLKGASLPAGCMQ